MASGPAANAAYTYFPDRAAVLRGLGRTTLGRVNHDRSTDLLLALELRAELLDHPVREHRHPLRPLHADHLHHTMINDQDLTPLRDNL